LSATDDGCSVELVDDLSIERDDLPGGWLNFVRVARRFDEFTIDFLRADPFEPRAFLVSRVVGSPTLVVALRDSLAAVWHDFLRETMPPGGARRR
jgi:hypothetical protein